MTTLLGREQKHKKRDTGLEKKGYQQQTYLTLLQNTAQDILYMDVLYLLYKKIQVD
jgi:hypothetical protein